MDRKAIVTVAAGNHYPRLLGRLLTECARFGVEPVHAWANSYPYGSPQHRDSLYAFKGYAMKQVMDQQQPDMILWMDAAVFPIAPLDALWEKISEDGYYCQNNGFTLGEWASDRALHNFCIEREPAFLIPELSSMVVGLDLRREEGRSFVDDWFRFSADGSTNGTAMMNDNGAAQARECYNPNRGVAHLSDDPRVLGHKCDQTICTWLAWQRGWVLTDRPKFVDYKSSWDEHRDPRTILLNHGG